MPEFFKAQLERYKVGNFSTKKENKNRQKQQKNQRDRKSEVKKNHIWTELSNISTSSESGYQQRFIAVKFGWLYFHRVR
jgi:hypothetical protein